mmetsp:Transcript_24845/g.28540  ORF Transcript_24845/g.28540 Transcript_24845/m.28540 type:complete len:81 (+) Transcript_24845:1003-1245(+)
MGSTQFSFTSEQAPIFPAAPTQRETHKSVKPKKKLPKVNLQAKAINIDLFAHEKPNEFFSIRLLSSHVAHILRSKELTKK